MTKTNAQILAATNLQGYLALIQPEDSGRTANSLMCEEDWYFDISNSIVFNPLETNTELKYTDKYSEIEDIIIDGTIIVLVWSEGGYEGGGDSASNVFGIFEVDALSNINPEPISYFMVNGFYSSYNGTEWNELDEWRFVKPTAKTVIDWVVSP